MAPILATITNEELTVQTDEDVLDKPNFIEIKVQNFAQRDVTEGVDIATLQIDRPLADSNNSLEFLLMTLSRSFELTPRQAAALLTDSNQYLVTACVKGVKGGYFQPIINWYQEIHDNLWTLIELLQAELAKFNDVRSIQKVLATVASGLYSSNSEVVRMTLRTLTDSFEKFN
jgi:hypothetical protein